MNKPLIEGLSAVGISLLILAVFIGSQKNKGFTDMSSHALTRDLGFNISDSTHSDDTFYSRESQRGGKRKNKSKTKKNKV